MGSPIGQADALAKTTGFKVEISGGPDATSLEGGWRSFSWTGMTVDEIPGTTGGDQIGQTTRGLINWGQINLIGAFTKDRKFCLEWFTAQQNGETGDAVYKTVTVTYIKPDNTDGDSHNFHECFLTEYQLSPLRSDGGNEVCVETVTLQVGRYDQQA